MRDPLHARRLRARPAARSPRRASRPTSSTSTSGCPRCRSTRASAASPTPTTRRWTCGWTPSQELTAREIVNTWERRRLARALREYGEERYADRIAGADRARAGRSRPPSSSSTRSRPRSPRPRASPAAIPPSARSRRSGSPSTRSSPSSTRRCRWPGRSCSPAAASPAISFHSLEDRRVKRFLADRTAGLHLPARPAGLRLRPHARRPSSSSAAPSPPARARSRRNPRSRSARLRAARKLKEEPTRCRPHRRGHARGHARRAPAPAPPAARSRARSPGPSPPSRCRRRAAAAPPASSSACARSPSTALVDRLLRGRAWIWLIGIMLGGIVAMQVSLLKLNSGISRQRRAGRRRSSASTPTSRPRSRALVLRRADPAHRRRGGHGRAAGRRRRLPHRAPAAPTRGSPPSACSRRATRPREVMANGGRALAPLAPATVAPAIGTTGPAVTRRSPPIPPSPPTPRRHRRARADAYARAGGHARAHARSGRGGADRRGDRRRDGPGRLMKLIERRIGLLFAVFLGLLVIGAGAGRLARRRQGRHAQAGRGHPAGVRPASSPRAAARSPTATAPSSRSPSRR